MRVESDDHYQGPRPVPNQLGEDATPLGCLGLTVAVVVSIAFWYFAWQLLRWVLA